MPTSHHRYEVFSHVASFMLFLCVGLRLLLRTNNFTWDMWGNILNLSKKLGRMRSMSKEVTAIAYELRSRRILYRSASTEKVVQEFHEDQLGSEILWSPKLACKIEFFRNKNTSHTIKMSWTSGPCHMKMPSPGPNSYLECQDTCFVITWQSIELELRSGLMKSPITSITTYNHL